MVEGENRKCIFPSAVNLTLLYINSEVVIPANTLKGNGAGIQPKNTGFRVKPGMTNKAKKF
jgi:hypothetical protein